VRIAFTPSLIAVCLTLAGCGAEVTAPSLMPRAVEKQPIEMPISSPVEPDAPVDGGLRAAIAEQLKATEAADAKFEDQRKQAEAMVTAAAGTAQGGEVWVQAQEAITALESARIAVRDAAAAIDALRLEPANAASGNRAAIDVAAERIRAIEDRQTAVVAALVAKLG